MARMLTSNDLIITPEFDLWQIVYLKTNDGGQPYQIVGLVVSSIIKYRLQCLGEITEHEAHEITPDLDAALLAEFDEMEEEP